MMFAVNSCVFAGQTIIKMRCPACKRNGTFEPLPGGMQDVRVAQPLHFVEVKPSQRLPMASDMPMYTIGSRRCPDPACHTHIFFVANGNDLVTSYPAELVDFDQNDLPDTVRESISEAVVCHSNQCFVAAAIMVRKCMEEMCLDKGATGGNLVQKIQSLQSRVSLPQAFIDGLNDVRLLGNDAAHVQSQTYNQVGAEEVATAIEVVKEILKNVYQMDGILRKMQVLKRVSSSP